MKKRLITFFCLFAVFLCACQQPDYVKISSDISGSERALLDSVFAQDEFAALGLLILPGEEDSRKQAQPALLIEISSSWGSEASLDSVIISKTYFVPQADPLDGRSNISFEDCFEDGIKLVLPEEIVPPFVALRVDGLALGDEAYPLVKKLEFNIRTPGDEEPSNELSEKMRILEEALRIQAASLVQSAPMPLWIAVCGDMMLDAESADKLIRQGPESIFGGTAAMLASADLTIVNFEGVASNSGVKANKSFTFRMLPEIGHALKAAGIDVVLHANNHVVDFGKDAMLESISNLRNAGLGVIGAGVNIEAASEPFVYQHGGETYRVFGIGSFWREWSGWDGINFAAGTDIAGMLHARRWGKTKLKERLSSGGDTFDIVFFHGGDEWTITPEEYTQELYTEFIEAGADLVIGSHPHRIQGFQWVEGKPVFWSLGNYFFGGEDNTIGEEDGLFIRLGFLNGKLLYLDPFPLTLSSEKIDIAPQEELAWFYELSNDLITGRRMPGTRLFD